MLALPPVMPLTFQVTAAFAVFWTVAVNCWFCFVRTLADAGETLTVTAAAATTATDTVFETSPSVVDTVTGTDVFAAGALPVAVTRVDETTVVGSAAPSKETTDPAVNPAPLTVSVKLPTGTGDGLTDVIVGNGMIVTLAVPLADEDVLVARIVTVAGFGTVEGAV